MATCVISATEANLIPVKTEGTHDRSERSLVQRAQEGDGQAFGTLFELHKKRVYSVCLLMTKDVAEAEDLTQEAFLQVFRTISTLSRSLSERAYLARLAVLVARHRNERLSPYRHDRPDRTATSN
jgi:DNA-directed RNA polymerase specialized sigma24 family protein